MELRKLIELLEEMAEIHGDNAEVRLMTQQAWPFENRIHGVCFGDDINGVDDGEDGGDVESESVVYIVEGGQICYGSKKAWDAC